MAIWEVVEYKAPQYDPDIPWEVSPGIKGLRLSYREPYVSRESKKTVGMINSLETVNPGTPYEFKALKPVRTKHGWRVHCSACGWRGYRKGYADCECYEDWGGRTAVPGLLAPAVLEAFSGLALSAMVTDTIGRRRMAEFGLIIDNEGVPGLHSSLGAAKRSLEAEIVNLWKDLHDTSGWWFYWSFPVDGSYETVTVYDGDAPSPVMDDYLEFQVWEVSLPRDPC